MRIWRHTPLDSVFPMLSVAQLGVTLGLALTWATAPMAARAGGIALLVAMTTYNIVIVSHLFCHQPWFRMPLLNRLASMLNSVNIGQSVQAYQLLHVRNHHLYNNDRKGPDGTTRDLSSTYRHGHGDDHASLVRYAFFGAVETLGNVGAALVSATRLFRVAPRETTLLDLAAKGSLRQAELRQIQLDRLAHFAAIATFAAISWQWTLYAYLPALYLSFVLVNVQNYYEHYGATPRNRYADSVSYYGRLYNMVTFNDGYHQEHHLRPQRHWSGLPDVRRRRETQLAAAGRVVSSFPAMLRFLQRGRALSPRREAC